MENIPDQEPPDSISFLLSVRARLIAYIFLATQCPFLSPYFSFDICLVFEMICSIDNDVTRTVLIAQGVSFLLHPASTSFTTLSSSHPSSHSSSTNLLKQKLELVFSHPFILPYLISTTHIRTSESFRGRFLASLCIGMESLLEKYTIEIKLLSCKMDYLNKNENKNEKEKNEKFRNDSLLISLANLMNLLSCVPLILSTFGR